MGLLSALFGFDSKAERKEAQRLGISVSETTRDLPHFSRYGNEITLKPGQCVRYAVSRQAQKPTPMWSLLQRSKELGATLPNEYLLTQTGRLPDAFEEGLRKVAEEFAEELFEFEGTATDVAVYWQEWGGPTKVRALHEVLSRLAQW
jgi:hypothetical protein